ncbi:MAG: NAD(P)/FAD-dependent oxidoreductase, partial [Candidatus Margulisiibacteriota bacterium]
MAGIQLFKETPTLISSKVLHYDIAVIGGGPAGLMAAGIAAENGAKVILIEKNDTPGRKLLITGKERCNITNAENDIPTFIKAFGKQGKFLCSALHAFGVDDIINFFNQRRLETKVERGNRVFPVSDKALDVLQVLLDFLKEQKVRVRNNCSVVKLVKKGEQIEKVKTSKGDFTAKKYILCTGGRSYPNTGSSGDGFAWAKQVGHKVINTYPSLAPVRIKEPWAQDLQGLSLRNVRISVYQFSKKQDERFGEALFTHEGMSGPIILDLSKKIGELLKNGEVELRIDLKQALEYPKLDARIQRDFKKKINSIFKNSLDELLPKSLIPVIIKLSGIDPQKKVNTITKEERNKLLHLLKELKLTVTSLFGFERAITTTGGIDLKEIDPRTMRSKLIDNLYFAGEVIDLDGPTGGFNLQMCW